MNPYISCILALLLFAGCSHQSTDPRLEQVAAIVSDSPLEALSALDSIDGGSLSEADRHYYDLLTVKARDKAYITHTSDSLILDVIGYESRHKGNGRLAEALYYGGRVYSDLGDYPASLGYFQDALDLLPPDTEDQDLRARALSQTGRLLQTLFLFDEAIPYLKEVVEIDRANADTISVIHDLQLLGGTNTRNGDYRQAEKYLMESLDLGNGRPSYHAAKSRAYIAVAKYRSGDIDSALFYIRNTPDEVVPVARNFALAYASYIYWEAGIPDSAYMYAKELVTNDDPQQKEAGYQVLLSPELRSYLNEEERDMYLCDYRALLADYYDENKNQLAINQRSRYNYRLQELKRTDAERKVALLKSRIIIVIMAFLLIFIVLALLSLYFKNKSKNNIIELHRALSQINRLKYELGLADLGSRQSSDLTDNSPEKESGAVLKFQNTLEETEDELRNSLKRELMALYAKSDEYASVSRIILDSDAYRKLQEYIQRGQIIHDADYLWNEIENVVLESSPKFRTNLNLLAAGNISTIDFHTALLIKCGIRPSKMCILLGRSNGAIVSRRETLSMKILGCNKGMKVIDGIIRLL